MPVDPRLLEVPSPTGEWASGLPASPPPPGGAGGSRVAEILTQLAPVLIATMAGRQAGPQAVGAVLGSQAKHLQHQREEQLRQEQIDYTHGEVERRRREQEAQQRTAHQEKAADFRLKAIQALAQIDDPAQWTAVANQLDSTYAEMFGGQEGEIKNHSSYSDAKRLKGEQGEAAKQIGLLEKKYGAKEIWEANPTVTFNDKPMKYRDLVALAGLQAGELAPQTADPEGKTAGSFDAQFNDDLAVEEARLKRTLTAEERSALRLKSKKVYDAANDRPVNTQASDFKVQTRIDVMRSRFGQEPIVKAYNEISTKAQTIKEIVSGPQTGPGDLAIVFEFMKGLDPTSVVRETEFANAAKSGNVFKGAFAKFNGYFNPEGGTLPPEVKKEFLRLVQVKLNAQTAAYKNLAEQYGKQIDRLTKEPGTGKDYLVDYSGAFPDLGAPEQTPAKASATEKLNAR